MRLAWETDIHLDFLTAAGRRRFLESVAKRADALVVTGDIAEGNSLGAILTEMDALVRMPVYFVLGNQDFHHGSVAGTRSVVAEIIRGSKTLVYLSQAGVVELTHNTALVGHDGWGDGRLGDLSSSGVILDDFRLIGDLRQCWRNAHTLDKPALRRALQALGDEAASYLNRVLALAARQYSKVLLATHIPPFRQAGCRFNRVGLYS